MPNGFSPNSKTGDSTRTSKPSDVCSRLPKSASWNWSSPRSSTPSCRSPRFPAIPPRNQTAEQLPTYNAYSIDGDVTAPLVYVNYGSREDYEQLDRLGISVKGAIVIARYGEGWRGIKPKVAAEHGAIGCIIYSDPNDDGYFQGRRLSQGRLASQRGCAARQRDGYRLSRRSANSRSRRDGRRQAACPSRKPRRSPKFPCCRFHTPTLCRCSPR